MGLMDTLKNDPEAAGSQLINIAGHRAEKSFTEDVLRQVQELITHQNNLFIARDKTEAEIILTQRRLSAINSGEITIETNGKIKYNESGLNFH